MSFSKAKIQRFNDIRADCTPSPAKYNVVSQEKIKLGIISNNGKYLKKTGNSPQSSEAGSVNSTPCFQTPTVPIKKKKLLGMSFKSITKTGDLEELRDKIVECNNKDLYIKDLLEQIDEMKGKMNQLEKEKNKSEETLLALKRKNDEDNHRRTKEYNGINKNVKEVSQELKHIRQKYEDLKNYNFVEMSKLLSNIGLLQELYNKTLEETAEEVKQKVEEFNLKERQWFEKVELLKKHLDDFQKKQTETEQHHVEELDKLVKKHNEEKEDMKNEWFEEIEALKKDLDESQKKQFEIEHLHVEELEKLVRNHNEEKESMKKKLEENEAKIDLLEENFKDVNLLTELQMKQKIDEIEDLWKQKLEDKEKEHEAILKECQEISEYSIIQSEIEKNLIKKQLEDKEQELVELTEKITNLKNEKHAYELSINTFKDTIEVLKKRLFDSDRDVEQLKEELEKCEEKILTYEKKCTELTNQLQETQTVNEELEMQYESTSKLMQTQVENVEKNLLAKVEALKEESKQLLKDKELLNDVLAQHHEQQILISRAQEAISQSVLEIEVLQKQQVSLEEELEHFKKKAMDEAEEAAAIRKKYIEKSGKHDKLAHQFEQVLQELDQTKLKIQDLEKLIGPYQEQLEAYQNELKLLSEEKSIIEKEAQEISLKYAHILGHQNHQQKIKYVKDLQVKKSEIFQKNIELEAKNYKLTKQVEKLMKDVEDLKKPTKKTKILNEDKENLGSPKCIKGTQSPGPLKDKN